MAEAQMKDSVLGLVIPYVHVRGKTKGLGHFQNQVQSRTASTCSSLIRLVMKQGVLHQIYITNDVQSHQLVLPRKYHQAMLHMLHDDYGHQ